MISFTLNDLENNSAKSIQVRRLVGLVDKTDGKAVYEKFLRKCLSALRNYRLL